MTGRFLRDPVSAISHLAGVIMSIVGLVVLVWQGARFASARYVAGFAIFGASLILLYTASTLYHSLRLSERGVRVLRKIDHMMIFVLIAGTYTPICLIALEGAWRWALLASVWGLAIAGMVLKGFRIGVPRWLSTGLYLAMGWLIVIAVGPMLKRMPLAALIWLAVGGALYSIGAVFYGLKWPNFSQRFGFHELFHLFVLGGSVAHYMVMLLYLVHV